jgi:EXPERA (EXPanded EBP superfamily)
MTAPVIDAVTVTSLLAALGVFVLAYGLSWVLLPKTASTRSRILFVWHSFDSLIHFFFEGSFLYNCFFTYLQLPGTPSYVSQKYPVLTPPGIFFLGQEHKNRLYGSFYGEGPTAKLWQEYAKADKRWGGADLGVISLELLTVFLGGPIAAYICYLLTKGYGDVAPTEKSTRMGGKLAFWLIVLATAELYGGKMIQEKKWYG